MIVEESKVVTITYELRENNAQGELMERMNANYPFIFLFGTGKLLAAFEEKLRGLKKSDAFEFVLSPTQAYGPIQQGNIIDVERALFETADEVTAQSLIKGNYVALTDDLGDVHNGRILDWSDDKVTIDFNHAMAGKTLHFKGAILNIRPASIDELVRQHYIQEDGISRPEFGKENDPDDWWKQ